MRQTGTLRIWHDERGYGFIAPIQGGRELFVHVSAFPQDGSRPLVGERLGFEVAAGKDGQTQAVRVQRLAWAGAAAPLPAARQRPMPQRRPWRLRLLMATIVLALGAVGYRQARQAGPPAQPVQARQAGPPAQPVQAEQPGLSQRLPEATAPAGRCDSRTHCSQMTSCAEATYFLRNCPGVQMDGDGDGIPCEGQWCTGPGAP